jgi:rhamnose utilization protein RhaD (predicted bifunctional aldolase and dehydrogenase)
MKLDGFATLYMDKLEALKGLYRGPEHEDEMVGYLPHCTFGLNPRAASIDTPLHAYVPRAHVDHMHADAIIAIAASADSRELTAEIFGDEIGWLPWKRPGFELGLWLERFARRTRRLGRRAREPRPLHLGRHARPATRPRSIINRAIDWLDKRTATCRPSAAPGTPPCRRPSAAASPPR